MEIKIEKAKQLTKAAWKAGITTFWESAPGIGKTFAHYQMAEELDRPCFALIAPLYDPTTMAGAMYIEQIGDEKRTKWALPDLMPLNIPCVFIIDDITSCVPAMQAIFYRFAHERKLGDVYMGDNCYVGFTGNRMEDKAIVYKIGTALNSRWMKFKLCVDHEGYYNYAIKHDFEPFILAFNRFRPELLHNFDPNSKTDTQFPCPRSWETLNKVYKELSDKKDLPYIAEGAIGQAASVELGAFHQMFLEMVDPREAIRNPEGIRIPTEKSTLYALSTAVAHLAEKKNIGSVMVFASRLTKENASNRPFEVLIVRDILTKDINLFKNLDIQKWHSKNSEVII